jgi:hypothetical protein
MTRRRVGLPRGDPLIVLIADRLLANPPRTVGARIGQGPPATDSPAARRRLIPSRYCTAAVESGWIPVLYSYEGQTPLHGTFFSDDIEDYYVSHI